MYNFHQFVLEAQPTLSRYMVDGFICVWVDEGYFTAKTNNVNKTINEMNNSYEHLLWYELYSKYVNYYYEETKKIRNN